MEGEDHEDRVRQIVYTSLCAPAFQKSDIMQILAQSVRNNQRDGISGFLIYKNGHFRQLIEGSSVAISSLYTRIGADSRHVILRKDLDRIAQERAFPMWAMALSGDNPAANKIMVGMASEHQWLKGYIHVLDTSACSAEDEGDEAISLMSCFEP
jgi:FAD-dependent sensor of blue light